MRSLAVLAASAGLSLFAAAPVEAVLVQYSGSGDTELVAMSNGLNATVTLDVGSSSVELTPGVPETVLLNGGILDVFQGSNAFGSDTLAQTLTIQGGGSQGISQGVSITTTAPNPPFDPATADIAIFAGPTVIFTLPGGYELEATPQGGVVNGQTSTEIVIFNNVEFLLTQVPEPASGLLALAATGLLLTRRRGA